MKIVPANKELSDKFYGKSLPVSSRGFFLLNDEGEPIGTAGFIRKAKNLMILYTEGHDEAYNDKKMIIKFARLMLDIADANGWDLLSYADESKETAPGFAAHFGFEPTGNAEGEYVRWAR